MSEVENELSRSASPDEGEVDDKDQPRTTTNAEYGPPKAIGAEQFDELIAGFGIEGIAQRQLVDRLQLIVDHFQRNIGEEENVERERMRQNLQDVADRLAWAAKIIGNAGVPGNDILRLAAPGTLNFLFDWHWLQERFPDDILGDDEMPAQPPVGSRIRRRIHSRTLTDAEQERQFMAEAKYSLLQSKGHILLPIILDRVSHVVSAALDLSKSTGGRTPNKRRHEFVVNLAAAWHDVVGRGWNARGGQSFGDFCSAIFGYVGWPVKGLDKAIGGALKDVRLNSRRA